MRASSQASDFVRVVVISDTEGRHEELDVPEGDVLIHAGDLTENGELSDIEKIDAWLGTLPHKHKVVVPGNHDLLLGRIDNGQKFFKSATYLKDREVEVEGLKIYGSPYTPPCGPGAFHLKYPGMLASTWKRVPEDTDVLITHGPPKGILDTTQTGRSVGDPTLTERLAALSVRLHVFGHVHEARGITTKDGTVHANAACIGAKGAPLSPAMVFLVPRKGLPVQTLTEAEPTQPHPDRPDN